MEPSPSPEERVRYQFESFCKMVIHGERCDYMRELRRRTEREVCFSDLPEILLDKLCAVDADPANQYIFQVFGYLIPIQNDHLAESLLVFGAEGYSILLLAYSLCYSDGEIAALLGVSRSKVQRVRKKLFDKLKLLMCEEQEYEE